MKQKSLEDLHANLSWTEVRKELGYGTQGQCAACGVMALNSSYHLQIFLSDD